MQVGRTHTRGLKLVSAVFLALLVAPIYSQSAMPRVNAIAPEIIGIGGKVQIVGRNLGSARDAVVQFNGGVIASRVERQSSTEIVVRVPLGAKKGPIRVITGVNAAAAREAQRQLTPLLTNDASGVADTKHTLSATIASLLSRGRTSNTIDRFVTMAYMTSMEPVHKNAVPLGGVNVLRNRVIVDLKDFLSFQAALDLGKVFGGQLVGHLPVTNSYIYDLNRPPSDALGLYRIMNSIKQDPRVAEVSPDVELVYKGPVTFADTDVVNRYKINSGASDNGREDVWAFDRVQAPGAWNLIERFIGRASIGPVKMAQLDTGVNQNHVDFAGVSLKMAQPVYITFNLAGSTTILPDSSALALGNYTLGDDASQHGTRVASVLGAANGNVIVGNNRGTNGMMHNPMQYELLVMRGSAQLSEAGDNLTLTDFLIGINIAAIWGAQVMNASWGQPQPLDPATDPAAPAIRVGLRKLAHQLNQFSDQLLLCIAAGNEAQQAGSYNQGEVTPFEDLNLNNKLDAGEDFDGDGKLGQGNYIGASLGTLPNVITVGAINQQDQRAGFSNFGSRKPASTADTVISIAAPGVSVFTAGANPANSFFNIGAGANNRYQYSNGTSFATPLTCGSAALIEGICGCYMPADLKTILVSNGLDVNTTDQNGSNMVWRTLKTGYAVRKALLEHGFITDDQPFSGVSKMVVTSEDLPGMVTMELLDVRRGADGRAEPFAPRGIPNGVLSARNASLSHDGRELSYISPASLELGVGSASTLASYFFDLDVSASYVTEAWDGIGGSRLSRALEFSPTGDLMYGLFSGALIPDTSGKPVASTAQGQLKVLTPTLATTIVADSGVVFTPEPGPDDIWYWGETIQLFDTTWRPDGLRWDHVYAYIFSSVAPAGANNMLTQIYPSPPLGIATGAPPATSFGPVAYAPDGFGWAAGDLTNKPDGFFTIADVRTEFYTSGLGRTNIAGSPHMGNPIGGSIAQLSDLHWSPDGSEVAVEAFKLWTMQRDARNIADRALKLIYAPARPIYTVTWQW